MKFMVGLIMIFSSIPSFAESAKAIVIDGVPHIHWQRDSNYKYNIMRRSEFSDYELIASDLVKGPYIDLEAEDKVQYYYKLVAEKEIKLEVATHMLKEFEFKSVADPAEWTNANVQRSEGSIILRRTKEQNIYQRETGLKLDNSKKYSVRIQFGENVDKAYFSVSLGGAPCSKFTTATTVIEYSNKMMEGQCDPTGTNNPKAYYDSKLRIYLGSPGSQNYSIEIKKIELYGY